MSNLALTGIPRGGTTLACKLLGTASDTLALFEPMPVEQLAAPDALDQVSRYFADVRQRALVERKAPSKHVGGRVPDNPFGERGNAGQVRPWLADLGDMAVEKPLSEDFLLVIKHNAAFTALLPALAARMSVIGIVRNPLAVLASWHSVDLPVSRGRLPAGERLDAELAARLDAQPDCLRRQIMLLDWFFNRLLHGLSADRLVRYEDMVATHGACLIAAAQLSDDAWPGPGTPLSSRNASAEYDRRLVGTLAAALCRYGRECLTVYTPADILELASIMAGDRT